MESLCGLKNNLVVHRAAEKRVRMAHDSHKMRIGGRRGPERCFESACRPMQKKTSMENFSHDALRGCFYLRISEGRRSRASRSSRPHAFCAAARGPVHSTATDVNIALAPISGFAIGA